MTTFTPKAAIPVAELTDAPNINTYANALGTQLDGQVTPTYASTTARDAANPAPVEGDKCYVTGLGLLLFNGVDWRYTSSLQNWTPVWSTSTGSHTPSYGNSVVTGRFTVINGMCFYSLNIVFGSSTNFGSSVTTSDNYTFSLPVNVGNPNAVQLAGYGSVLTGASSKGKIPTMFKVPGNGLQVFMMDTGGGPTQGGDVTNTGFQDGLTPYTWTIANTASIEVQGFYEVAVL